MAVVGGEPGQKSSVRLQEGKVDVYLKVSAA